MNKDCVDQAIDNLNQYDYPSNWATAESEPAYENARGYGVLHQSDQYKTVNDRLNEDNCFVENIMHPVTALEGESLPVSAFTPGGFMPSGATNPWRSRHFESDMPLFSLRDSPFEPERPSRKSLSCGLSKLAPNCRWLRRSWNFRRHPLRKDWCFPFSLSKTDVGVSKRVVGTTAYEKRGIATEVPVWIPDTCTQCNYCTRPASPLEAPTTCSGA
jgi:hypothetical protein